ncbi:MAG: D-alanyl-D-alanine carboxypeptidase [Bacilli bacterium]|nr:D-alanyl-D-alanine carboxypeptidase [Bacilli bacterium]
MKKVFLFLLVIFPFSVKAISASAYIVMDADSGRVLEGENINSERLIASISKIMTAIVAIEYGDIESVVKVDDSILKAYGSGIYIQVGEELTLDDLLYGLMLRSGNDAALAIAKSVSGDISSFVYLMNQKALEIGMNNTLFLNPSGLEENDGNGNKSTVYDMALLMKYAMNNEHFRRITSTKDIVVKSSYKTYKWVNKNKLLSSYEYCTGGKTGYTEKAKRTLVTSASNNDMNLIVVTFNDGNDFSDHKSLYEKYFNKYEKRNVLKKDELVEENIYVKNEFNILVNNEDNIKLEKIIDNKDKFYNGDIVGRINVYLNNEKIGYRYLYYKKELVSKEKGFLSKLLDILKFWD